MNVREFRQQYPMYNDLSDQAVADSLWSKHSADYADLGEQEFKKRFLGTTAGTHSTGGSEAGPPGSSVPAMPTTPGQVFTAVPKFAFGVAKNFVEDAANYPQARLLDPAVQSYRAFRGLLESDPAKRHQNAQPTPEEAARNQKAKAFELGTAVGGAVMPKGPIAAMMAKSLPARLTGNAVLGAAAGATDAGVRENTLAAVPFGAIGGAAAGPILGEFMHRVFAKPTAPRATGEPIPTSPPAAEGVTEAARMKAIPDAGVKSRATQRGLKGLLMGYHAPEPLLVGKKLASGEGMQDAFVGARRVIQDAPEEGTLAISDILHKHLKGNQAEQADLIRQHMTAASMIADLEAGRRPPQGFSPQQLEQDYIETAIRVSQDPQVQAAVNELNQLTAGRHAEFTGRGYALGKVKNYTPLHGLETTEKLLPEGERAGRTPSFMKARGKEASLRDYDVIKHLAEYETAARKKLAEDDLFTKIARDPMNLLSTEAGRAQIKATGVPEGYVRYEAPMGSPGFGKAREAKVSSAARESRNAILARKDLIQRAAREADEAATSALERLERSRKRANILADNAVAVTKARERVERSVQIAREKRAALDREMTGPQRQKARYARTQANNRLAIKEQRLEALKEKETVLIQKARDAADKVARSEASRKATAATMKKKASSLMAKAEKVGQKAERIKTQAQRKSVTMVLPADVAEALSHFYERPMGNVARVADKAGQKMAQAATTLNPPNRFMNIPSDLITMLAGPAGEKGTFTKGIALRRLMKYPGAMNDMMTHAFGGRSQAANEGRKMGAVSGTFQKEIGGVDVPHDLAPFYYPAPMKERLAPGRVAKKVAGAPFDLMRRLSMGTEAAPRLATSKEATERGLPPEEVRRLAHESSLPYGSGASKFARSKPAKAFARFATYPSLADVRIVQGLTKGGSRARYAALLTIPPAVAAELNTRDAEHAAAEKRLKPWIKNTLHFLVKNDKGGFDVVVVRADPFSEGTARWGMGQLSGRVVKAAKGVEPLDFSKAPSEVKDAYASFYPIGPAYESITGKNKYGKKMTAEERVANVLPFVRFGAEAFEAVKEGGPKAGAKQLITRGILSGARPVPQEDAFQKAR